MRNAVQIAVLLLLWTGIATAQAPQRPRQAAAKKTQPVPSIIQSELDRSRAEEKQKQTVVYQPVPPPASTPAWPLFVSLVIGAVATGALLLYFAHRRGRSGAAPQGVPSPVRQFSVQVPAAMPRPAAAPRPESVPDDAYAVETRDDTAVMSTSPYVNDDETEMPEAALTMNLLNKKRETKKELILEVMKRVQRKENPQHIAEALRIGIGEVHLAMTLAKLKK